MLGLTRKLWAVLPSGARETAVLLCLASLVGSVTEVGGVVLAVPFVQLVARPDTLTGNVWLAGLFQQLGFQDTRSFLLGLGLLLIVVVVFRECLGAVIHHQQTKLVADVHRQLSERLLQTYLGRPYRWLLGRSTSRMTQNILVRSGTIVYGVLQPLAGLVSKGILFLVLAGTLVYSSPQLALATLALAVALHVTLYKVLQPRMSALGREVRDCSSAHFRAATEAFAGIKEAKFAGCEPYYFDLFARHSHRLAQLKVERALALQIPRHLLRGGLLVTVIGVGLVLLLQESGHTAGSVILFLLILARMAPVLQSLVTGFATLRCEEAIVEELYEDLKAEDAKALPREDADQQRLRLQESVALEAVTFRYEADRPVALDRVAFSVDHGASVAVVGLSGAGKTTLVDVLIGLLEPEEGRVLVDGRALNGGTKGWRKAVGYVPQDNFLFQGTLAENIAFGAGRPDLDRVARCGRLAALDDFVQELKSGYETVLGDGGAGLSRGQRQRIGLARALYREPDILVLDEATSALDTVTEAAVMTNLRDLGITLVLVTHRLAAARDCERILVLHRGRHVGSGTFDSLMEECPEFQSMVSVARQETE